MNKKESGARDRMIERFIKDAHQRGREPDIQAIEKKIQEVQEKTDKQNNR